MGVVRLRFAHSVDLGVVLLGHAEAGVWLSWSLPFCSGPCGFRFRILMKSFLPRASPPLTATRAGDLGSTRFSIFFLTFFGTTLSEGARAASTLRSHVSSCVLFSQGSSETTARR